MDKETLSNYGWVIIVVVILAVMITLATPFGNYIKSGVETIVMSFDNSLGENGTGKTFEQPLILNGTIPDGGTYIVSGGPTLTGGSAFPATVINYDVFKYGDYTYLYKTSNAGWSVSLNIATTDKNKTSYGQICTSIDGINITRMDNTFSGCTALIKAPSIPDNVTQLNNTFTGCTLLTTVSTIPSSVTLMSETFDGCINLTGTIKNNASISSVSNMVDVFYGTVKPIDLIGSCACNNAVAGQYDNVTYNGSN